MKYWDLADLAGEHTNLEAQVEEALRLAERISYPAGIRMGEYASARKLLYESLRMSHHLGLPRGYTYSLEQLAHINEIEERYERAVQLWAAAETLRVHIGAPLEQIEQKDQVAALTRLRTRPGDVAFELEWAKGVYIITRL